MENSKAFIIFVSIALFVYASWNFYIFRRITVAAAVPGWYGWALNIILLLLILSFPLTEILSGRLGIIQGILPYIGGFWLGIMVYGLLFAVAIDILRLSDAIFHWFPDFLTADKVKSGRIMLGLVGSFILILLAAGYFISLNPKVREVKIKLNNLPAGIEGYKIAMFSDVHIGALVRECRVADIVNKVNNTEPDLILIPGDLFDENPKHLIEYVQPLKKLNAPDGIYAVTGNHEFYIGVQASRELMADAGIKLLRDETLVIENKLNLIGLDDITGSQQFRQFRKPVTELMIDADANLPTVLMHHTPVRIDEAAEAGIDLMVSGHTHGGQLFPGGHVAYLFYKVFPGLKKFGDMYFYLSTGAGTWGPPVRIGAPPEIVVFVLETQNGTENKGS